MRSCSAKSSSARRSPRRRSLGEHDPPRIDDHRPPAGSQPPGARRPGSRPRRSTGSRSRGRATAPASDRASWASVNAAGTHSTRAPRDGKHAIELGEAQVVADAQARGRGRPAVAVRTARRRAPRASDSWYVRACHVDVEEVNLAVGPRTWPSAPAWTKVSASFAAPGRRSEIEPATRSMPSSAASSSAHVTIGPSRA